MANPPRSRTVFVDTNLDTRMVMEVQEGDTVVDFKRKIEQEHTLCYPEIGEIGVNALKVKHKGVFYHLSDSMHVKSAFDEAKRKWFVCADACRLGGRGLEIADHLPEVQERINEAAVILQNVASLSGREDGNARGDALLNVREDLETEFDHMGYDHCRTSSSDTNKRVGSKVDGDYSTNGVSGQIRQLGEKRKIDDSQNPVDRNVSKVDFSGIQEANFARKKRKIEKKGKDSAKQINRNNDNSTTVVSDQGAQDAATCEQVNVTTSGANSTAVGMLCDSIPPVDARLESANKPTNEDPVKDHSHSNHLPIAATNVLTNIGDMVRQDPANGGSLNAKSTIDGEHFSGLTTAAYKSEVPAEKSERSTKQKKKKTKSTLQNHLATEVSVIVPMGINGVENVKATTDLQATEAAEKENSKTSAMQNTGEALNNPNQLPANQISLTDQNALLPTAPEVLHIDGASMSSKTRKTWKKVKDGECHKKRITTLGNESVTTQVDLVSNPSAESIRPQLERSNMSHSGLDGKNRKVAGFDAAKRDANGSSAINDVIGSEGSEMPVVKDKEPNPKASQLTASSEIKNHLPASGIGNKKLKRKRLSSTGPEIQLQDKLANPSQSSGDINSEDKSVVADKKEMRTAANNDGKNSSSNDAAHVNQVEGKLPESAVGNNLLVDDSVKPGAVASGDVIEKRIDVNEKTKDPEVKEISAVVKDSKKSQVESSQDSLSVRLPHGAILHSDTESFRVPIDRTLSSSGKQKLKISSKKFKQTTSETKSLHSPSASETRKSTSSLGATKQNKSQSKTVSRNQLKENAEAVTASNSSLRSLRGVQQTKSKQLATNKVVNADSSASRRKTLLSTNIFKDDYDESSEDESVSSGHSAGTYMDDSDVSEMEGDTGFATPITVGQRKAAEVDKDSSMNNYTLEKLRKSAQLEKLKRAQELGIQLEEFVPDSQIDLD